MWFAVYQVPQWWLRSQIELIVELEHNTLSVKSYKILLRMAVKNPKYSLFLSVEFIVAVPSLRLYGMWQLVAWYLGTFASNIPTASLSCLIEFFWRKFYLKKIYMKCFGDKLQVVYSLHAITQYGKKINESDVAFISKNFMQKFKKKFSRLKSETCIWRARARTHPHRYRDNNLILWV